MLPFQHILVPVDFGAAMQPAIDAALLFARKFDAKVTLVNTFDVTAYSLITPFAPPIDVEPLILASEEELKKVTERVRAEWPKTESLFERGSAAEGIVEAAKTGNADLIVLGTHGRRGVSRLLLGSVAESVVRLSPIPVMTVHPGPDAV